MGAKSLPEATEMLHSPVNFLISIELYAEGVNFMVCKLYLKKAVKI